MSKIKVAIVIDTCIAGGVSKALNDFIKCLYDKDLDITLSVRDIGTIESFYLPKGVNYKGWPSKKTMNFVDAIKSKWFKIIYKRNFQKHLIYEARQYNNEDDEYDCVIGYQMIANDVTIMTLEKINAKRKVLWLHGKKNFTKNNLKFFDDLYSKADLIVAVSKDTEDRFRSLMPKCANKITTVHNFYDIELINEKANEPINDFSIKNGEIVIVSTGRISKEKGFDRVPEVTQKLVEDGYNIKWYIIGKGDMLSSVDADIKTRKLGNHVYMLGYKDNPYPYVKHCDIYVQPSYTEGFCTSTMEAKILKKPVVTTNVPGMNEQFDNKIDGMIVESSVDGLYNGIKELIESKDLLDRIIVNLNKESVTNDEEVNKALKTIRG